MSYQIADFAGQMILVGRKNRGYPTLVAELQAIATALNADATSHDVTVALPPAPVKPGPGQTAFTNEALLLVNRGKGGNLTNAAMATAITAGLGQITPPVNTVAPTITYTTGGTGAGTVGAIYASGFGTWVPAATSYARQWLRNGATIPGATAASYTTVAADGGTSISCQVTGMNAAGEGVAVSNAAAIAAP